MPRRACEDDMCFSALHCKSVPLHQYTVFRVESSNDQRDFISGKKNGKINKIMKTSGAKIRFVTFINDYNFVIEVESTSFTKALDGITLLQEELPAEISFYVPESYHKRIIGVGGKNIQRIMKKYGVYVKFSNTEEFASLGGYYQILSTFIHRSLDVAGGHNHFEFSDQ